MGEPGSRSSIASGTCDEMRHWVEQTVDVQVVFGEDLGSLVDGVSGTVEDATEHVLGHGELHRGPGELDVRRLDIDSGRPLEDLIGAGR